MHAALACIRPWTTLWKGLAYAHGHELLHQRLRKGRVDGKLEGAFVCHVRTNVVEAVLVRDGKAAEAQFREPFDVLFSSRRFEYGDLAGKAGFELPTSSGRDARRAPRL
jgi:hypothetical protein